jgi:cytidine deaminase
MGDSHSKDRQPGAPPDKGDRELVAAAIAARGRAYCPYSSFAVGAALRTTDGAIYAGVNVENASYGLSMCAERNAIAAAVTGGMRSGQLAGIAIAAAADAPVSPCGACRQVIAEFAAADARVISVEVNTGKTSSWRAADLLPEAFRQ